jgi:hypothetical protein
MVNLYANGLSRRVTFPLAMTTTRVDVRQCPRSFYSFLFYIRKVAFVPRATCRSEDALFAFCLAQLLLSMALPQAASRFLGKKVLLSESRFSDIACKVPLGVAFVAVQASIYDVPGGFRAVMFDRFSGVKDKVSNCVMGMQQSQVYGASNTAYW